MTAIGRCGADALRIYVADSRTLDASLVADDDRERLPKSAHPRRRAQYLAGRALLRFALERSTGRPARSHRVTATRDGKPECVDGPAISVSHSGTLVACATAPAGAIGIDVQRCSARYSTSELARRHFCAAEIDWLENETPGAFYMLWVLKEAYLKALGCGLAGGLDRLDCRIAPPRLEARADVPAHLALYAAADAFIGVAAVGCAAPEIRIARAPGTAPPVRLIAAS